MSDLIRREDAQDIAYRRSASNNYFVSAAGADIAHAIRALPAVTVQAQIDAAVKAALREAADMVETGAMHGGEDTQVLLDVRDAILALIRKGDQP
jgi:hypothetical protein